MTDARITLPCSDTDTLLPDVPDDRPPPMTDARTRIRERRRDRRDVRRAREHREAERMAGVALRDSDPTSLLRPFLGERRALRITAAALVLGLLVWLLA